MGSLGHPSEDETGLIYMRARYMDPVTGRFVSEDPAKSGRNWFMYCTNNPVNHTDSTGLFLDMLLAAYDEFLVRGRDAQAVRTAESWGRDRIERVAAHYMGRITGWLVSANVFGDLPPVWEAFSDNTGFGIRDRNSGFNVHFDLSQHRGRGSEHIDFGINRRSLWQEFIRGFVEGLE